MNYKGNKFLKIILNCEICCMDKKKIRIRELSLEQLKESLIKLGEKAFRANQILEWIWKKNVRSFDEMSNLSFELRKILSEKFEIDHIEISDVQVSLDKTVKYAFELSTNQVIEGVLIPTKSRMTACISSQVGCSLACKFCATGKLKLLKNLTPGEIVDQFVYLMNEAETRYQQKLTNLVFMGMGEPLLNYSNVLKSIEYITGAHGLGFSAKRITVSTAGISKQIKRLADDNVKFNLALSLHAANDFKRNQIMEINESNDLKSLAEALQYFYSKTNTRVTFEYIIFKDFNDQLSDAIELADFCKNIPCKINIIEYNPIEGGEFTQADYTNVEAFATYLLSKNLIVNIRRSRGKDIDAACGQLANKNESINLDSRILKSK